MIKGSNRTFMELKQTYSPTRMPFTASSNRTFMELKLSGCEFVGELGGVLIVPLWN